MPLLELDITKKRRVYKMYIKYYKMYENAMQILQKRNIAKVWRHTKTLQMVCTRMPYKALSSNACYCSLRIKSLICLTKA